MHRVGRQGVTAVCVRPQRAHVAVEDLLLEIVQIRRLIARSAAELAVGVIGRHGCPVVVGAEVQILAVVIAQRVEGIDAPDVLHRAVHILHGLALRGGAYLIEVLPIEHDADGRGREHAVHLRPVSGDLGRAGRDLRITVGPRLIEKEKLVAGVLDLQDGAEVHEVILVHDVSVPCVLVHDIPAAYLLRGLGGRVGYLVGACQTAVDADVRAPVQSADELARRKPLLAEGEGVGKPGVDIREVFARQQRRGRKLRKPGELPLFVVGAVRTQRQQPRDHRQRRKQQEKRHGVFDF